MELHIGISTYLYIRIVVYFLSSRRKRGERAEVGRTRLFPLALRGRADSRIPPVYFTPRLIQ